MGLPASEAQTSEAIRAAAKMIIGVTCIVFAARLEMRQFMRNLEISATE